MRKNLTLSVIALLLLASFYSCTHSTSAASGGSITCKINGVSYTATKCFALKSTSGGNTTLTMEGAPTNYSTPGPTNPLMTFVIYTYNGIGTYKFNTAVGSITDTATSTIDSVSGGSATSYYYTAPAYGSIIITATSPNIVGTFAYTSLDSNKVTNGSFSIAAP